MELLLELFAETDVEDTRAPAFSASGLLADVGEVLGSLMGRFKVRLNPNDGKDAQAIVYLRQADRDAADLERQLADRPDQVDVQNFRATTAKALDGQPFSPRLLSRTVEDVGEIELDLAQMVKLHAQAGIGRFMTGAHPGTTFRDLPASWAPLMIVVPAGTF